MVIALNKIHIEKICSHAYATPDMHTLRPMLDTQLNLVMHCRCRRCHSHRNSLAFVAIIIIIIIFYQCLFLFDFTQIKYMIVNIGK